MAVPCVRTRSEGGSTASRATTLFLGSGPGGLVGRTQRSEAKQAAGSNFRVTLKNHAPGHTHVNKYGANAIEIESIR